MPKCQVGKLKAICLENRNAQPNEWVGTGVNISDRTIRNCLNKMLYLLLVKKNMLNIL